MSRLLIVSNRLPVSVERKSGEFSFSSSIGGLATGLGSFYKSYDSLWVGWPDMAAEEFDDASREDLARKLRSGFSCEPVFLNKDEIAGYYHGFSNETLWPTFHHFTQYAQFEQGTWEIYKHVNECFAEVVAGVYEEGDVVWIQDYQLTLLPGMLRSRIPSASIGFFLHIPFPSFEIFRMLPWRTEILNGLLGADLVGFHTYDYVQHFLKSVARLTTAETAGGYTRVGSRLVKADAFPMGIDFAHYEHAGEEPEVAEEVARIKERTAGRKIVLSLDRLDYTKGILHRLDSFDDFLRRYPEQRGKVTLILVAVPSRTRVKHYKLLKREVDELIGRINGEHGTLDWMPIWYLYRKLPFHRLSALYAAADVALVTPLRDGMNLIAKEYAAARVDDTGVLVLSELAGAAKEMGEALMVNPFNREETADALATALTMPEEEQKERMSALRKRLERFDVVRWAQQFTSSLAAVKEAQSESNARRLTEPLKKQLLADYESARHRLLLLGYDGSLVPYSQSIEARYDDELVEILRGLAEQPENDVVLVSGRDRATLERIAEGMPIGLILEHGAVLHRPGEEWETLAPGDDEWKEPIRQVMYQFADRTPGAFVEEKQHSIVWHYRASDPELGAVRAGDLKDSLSHLASTLGLGVIEGNKALEVKHAGVNKGQAALRWLSEEDKDFVLSVGHDRTDEDVFSVVPKDSWSVKVGWGPSRARFSVDSYSDVRALLRRMVR